jgi:apolipoprotein D and lipocalin family protein
MWLEKASLAAVLLGFQGLSTARAQTVTAVPLLDMTKFVGTWYEIARLPDKAQRKCVGDAFDIYTVGEKAGAFSLVTSCKLKDGTAQISNLSGRRKKKSVDGKLKVTTLWPFSRARWVLAIGPSYEWVLVGSPNRKTLWVMSRTATMAAEELRGIEGTATGEGFNVGRMVAVSQQP